MRDKISLDSAGVGIEQSLYGAGNLVLKVWAWQCEEDNLAVRS